MNIFHDGDLENSKRYIDSALSSGVWVSTIISEILETDDKNVPELITYLCTEKRNYIAAENRYDIASDPRAPASVLDDMIFFAATYLLHVIVKNPNMTAELLQKVYDQHVTVDVLANMVAHDNISDSLLEKILVLKKQSIDVAFARRKNVPTRFLETIAERDNPTPLNIIIKREDITFGVLEKLFVNPLCSLQRKYEIIEKMQQKGNYVDWPTEWVTAHYGVTI